MGITLISANRKDRYLYDEKVALLEKLFAGERKKIDILKGK